MKYMILRSPFENFDEVLNDPVIKKSIRTKIEYSSHLMLSFNDEKDEAYFLLKYGDKVIPMNQIVPDRTPRMDVDYTPDKSRGYLKWKSRQKD